MEGDEFQTHELNDSGQSEEDLRYITDDDLISSEDDNSLISNKPKKYNQLNSKAGFFHKLLKSGRPKSENIWREAYFTPRIHTFSSNHASKSNLRLKSSIEMAKSKKRKHEEGSSDSETYSSKKKVRMNSDGCSPKKIKRKERSHSISSSNDEDSGVVSSSQEKNNHEEHNHNIQINGAVNDNETVKYQFSQNQENDENNSVDSYEDTDYESSLTEKGLQRNIKQILEKTNITNNENNLSMQYSEEYITEDEEDMSEYSFLLDDNFIKNNHFWNLQCPANVETTNLVNQCLNLEENFTLEDGNNKFEAFIFKNNKNRFTTLAVPCSKNNFKLSRIPIAGNIIVEEFVNIKVREDFNIAETPQFVEFPDNLRTRHPLLGIDYQNQPKTIMIEKSHKKKRSKKHSLDKDNLSQSMDISSVYLNKEKHKKHDKETEEFPGVNSLNDDAPILITKRKKHKSKELDLDQTEEQSVNNSYEEKQKKKKHKRSKESN